MSLNPHSKYLIHLWVPFTRLSDWQRNYFNTFILYNILKYLCFNNLSHGKQILNFFEENNSQEFILRK
jgi:hypothetical protein